MHIFQTHAGATSRTSTEYEELLMTKYTSPFLELIPWYPICTDPTLLSLLPPGAPTTPLVTFQYSTTVGSMMFNYEDVAKMSDSEIATELQRSCGCSQIPTKYKHSVDPHVITHDPTVLVVACPHNPAMPQVAKVLGMGTKHRTTTHGAHFTFEVARKMDTAVSDGVSKYCSKIASFFNIHPAALRAYCLKLTQMLRDFICKISPNTVVDDRLMQATPGTPFTATPPNMAVAVTAAKDRFVFTKVDKASQNFAIICKKYYIETIMKDITNPTIYVPVANPLQLSLPEHIKTVATSMHPELARMGFYTDKERLPVYSMLAKLHKTPIG